jgi:RND family efflux transporter MFP subunit
MNLFHSLLLLSLLALAVAACTTEASPEKPPQQNTPSVVNVAVAPIRLATQAQPIRVSGVVAASEELSLSFKIGGVISAVYVDEGQLVKKGQLLARLDPQEIDAQVQQAEAGLNKRKRDLARVERLYADSVATLEQVQDLRTAVELAEADLKMAAFNQQYAEIYAPSRGKVLRRFAERGEVISAGAPVLRLAADNQAQVIRVGLADVDLVKVRLGDQAEVRFAAWPGQVCQARVSEIAAGADARTGTYAVELSLLPHDQPLSNGFIGKVSLLPSGQVEQVQLPIDALVAADAETITFYAPNPGDSTVRQVRIQGYAIGDSGVFLSAKALGAVQEAITEGARSLTPDSRVRVINRPGPGLTQLEGKP